jgi:hypothetical protein
MAAADDTSHPAVADASATVLANATHRLPLTA